MVLCFPLLSFLFLVVGGEGIAVVVWFSGVVLFGCYCLVLFAVLGVAVFGVAVLGFGCPPTASQSRMPQALPNFTPRDCSQSTVGVQI